MNKLKQLFTTLSILLSASIQAESSIPNDILEVLIQKKIIRSDSGEEVNKGFLIDCMEKLSSSSYKVECIDVIFVHSISYFEKNNKTKIILIIEDGASVENRWVYLVQGNKYVSVKNQVWPKITDSEVSRLLIKHTGNKKYTHSYIRSVAHSNYRVKHTNSNILKVSSGIPDENYGTVLGVLLWNGQKFEFKPKGS